MPNQDEYIYLVDAVSYDPVAEAATTNRWCTGEGWASKSNPAIEYEPRIIDAGNFESHIFQKGTSGGVADVGTGDILVNNGKHDIDYLLNHKFDSRPVIIRRGLQSNAEVADFEVLWTGAAETLEAQWNTYTLVLRDTLADIVNMILQVEQYAGNNSLPNGVEGVADDLKDKWKPVGFGPIPEAEPPMVNSSKYIFQLNWRVIASIQGVFVEGAALTPGNSRATLADLLANIPSGGTFDYYLGSGSDGAYIRLATLPDGKVTCSFTVGATAADRTAAAIVKKILEDHANLDISELVSASFTAVDALNDAEVYFWSDVDSVKIGDTIDEVAGSIQMWWAQTSTGLYKVGRIGPISGTPVGTIESWQILRQGEGIEFVSSNDPNKGIPPYQTTCFYGKIYTVQEEADLAGIVLTDRPRVDYLKNEYRSTSTAIDNDVLAAHPRSTVLEFHTNIADAAEAAAEATRRQALYGVDRFWMNVSIDISEDPGFNLGDLIVVDTGRTEWTGPSGRLVLVMGKTRKYREDQVQYTVWG